MASAAKLLLSSSDTGKQFLSCEEGKMIRFVVTLSRRYWRYAEWKSVGDFRPVLEDEVSDFEDE